jgi:DNA (cytosine-5)-methyltransferase 1
MKAHTPANNAHQYSDAKIFAEYFAGIGLVREGLRSSGWQCVYANDIDAKKRMMYADHFGESSHYHVEDIWRTEAVLNFMPQRPVFLATASFPCVDLSLAGHWKGFAGEHSSTYFGFLKVLEQLGPRAPKVVMLENVHGFLTSHDGRDFERAVCELASLGYWIDAIALDAKYFVPQSRPRVFVFGFHDSLDSPAIIRQSKVFQMMDEWVSAIERTAVLRPPALRRLFTKIQLATGWATTSFAPPTPCRQQLDDVLDSDDGQEWWSAEETVKHYEMMETPSRNRVDQIVNAGTTAIGTAFRRTRRGKTRTEVRFDVAGCLRTPKGGSAKQIIIAVAKGKLRMRWMSPIEYARLQGAPDFQIKVPPLQAMYGFGDGVCVPAIRWIADHMLDPVFESVSRIRSKQIA